MMNHDGIAKVFEVGTTERGQPYFVMEHVPDLSGATHRMATFCSHHQTPMSFARK